MPFEKFDRSRLNILPLDERVSDIDITVVMDPETTDTPFDNPKLDELANAVVRAREKNAAVILMLRGARYPLRLRAVYDQADGKGPCDAFRDKRGRQHTRFRVRAQGLHLRKRAKLSARGSSGSGRNPAY